MLRKTRTAFVVALVGALSIAGCKKPAAQKPAQPIAPAAAQATHGIDLAGMDRSLRPGDDFFGYANGTWVKTTQIPPDRSTWGVFAELAAATANIGYRPRSSIPTSRSAYRWARSVRRGTRIRPRPISTASAPLSSPSSREAR